AGLRFLVGPEKKLAPRRYALALRAGSGGKDRELRRELAPLGGERRLARWRPADRDWPEPPKDLFAAIASSGHARLILLTPALFSTGALPGWNRGTLSPA